MSTSNTAAATASGNKENPPAASKLKGIVKQIGFSAPHFCTNVYLRNFLSKERMASHQIDYQYE
uniref:Uncharacterized protein n=1 Tax=Glossina pallidipes TaxID=7398 RepID=A0A1A9Z6A0_GLOPL